MDENRFTITFNERGEQKHNWYIDKIAKGVNEYCRTHYGHLDHPEYTYGMICYDTKVLECWERILQKEGML